MCVPVQVYGVFLKSLAHVKFIFWHLFCSQCSCLELWEITDKAPGWLSWHRFKLHVFFLIFNKHTNCLQEHFGKCTHCWTCLWFKPFKVKLWSVVSHVGFLHSGQNAIFFLLNWFKNEIYRFDIIKSQNCSFNSFFFHC